MLLASKRGTLPATGGRFPRAPSLLGTHGLFRLSIPTPLWGHFVSPHPSLVEMTCIFISLVGGVGFLHRYTIKRIHTDLHGRRV